MIENGMTKTGFPIDFLSQKLYNKCDKNRGGEIVHQDSITCVIFERIEKADRNSVFIAADFLDLGEYHSVRQALLRLEKTGKIQKIMRGVYYCPRYSEIINEFEAPSPHKVAEALARKFNWTIAPCGETALNQLGLSTQVPAKWSFISDGPYHKFEIMNLTLEFKRRNNREISGMSPLTAMVIQALKALGKGNIDEKHINIIRNRLNADEKKTILKESQQSTMWIYETVKRICNG